MTITIVFFAAAREITGCDRLQLELRDGSKVADVQRELATRYPPLIGIMGTAMWSVNHRYASNDDLLHDGAEIGLILPVSGG